MTRRCSYSSAWRTASKPCQDRTDAENTDPIRGGGTIGKVAHEITISMGGILNSSTRRSLMQCWHWRFFLSMTRVSFIWGKYWLRMFLDLQARDFFFDVFDACLPKKTCETNSNETNNHMMCSLVGGFKHFIFSIIYGIILPIDSYFSRWLKPPTRFMLFSLCFPFFFHRFTNQSYGSSQSKASWDGCCWWTTRNLEGHYCFATEIAS